MKIAYAILNKINLLNEDSENPSDLSTVTDATTFTNYPKAGTSNAKKARDWKDQHGDEVKAGTDVGWKRASQLANKEPISFDTVKRISAFNRHRKNAKIAPEHEGEPWKDNGYVAWLIWGGTEMVDWAMNLVDRVEKAKKKKNEMNEPEDHPKKYMKGLSQKDQEKRAKELARRAKLPKDHPDKYEPLPTDKKVMKQSDKKESPATKAYRQMYGESKEALKNKAEETGISYSILKQVYDRGMGAYASDGSRPGMTSHQWAMGRVNSFITGKGGARKADADLWKKAKK